MALTYSPEVKNQEKLVDFTATSLKGEAISTKDLIGKTPILVMFICNHCPYVKAIEDRLVELSNFIIQKGGKVLAICSNDPLDYPEDHPKELLKKSIEKNYPFPYLFDESQELAKSFGAVCTPDLFLYKGDGTLAYRGQLDDSYKDSSKVTREDLKIAFLDLLNNQEISFKPVSSMGCSIKWKKK